MNSREGWPLCPNVSANKKSIIDLDEDLQNLESPNRGVPEIVVQANKTLHSCGASVVIHPRSLLIRPLCLFNLHYHHAGGVSDEAFWSDHKHSWRRGLASSKRPGSKLTTMASIFSSHAVVELMVSKRADGGSSGMRRRCICMRTIRLCRIALASLKRWSTLRSYKSSDAANPKKKPRESPKRPDVIR